MSKPKYTGILAKRPEPESETPLQDLKAGKYVFPESEIDLVLELLKHYDIDQGSDAWSKALYRLVVAMAKAHGVPAFSVTRPFTKPTQPLKRHALVGLVDHIFTDENCLGIREACQIMMDENLYEVSKRTNANSLRVDYQKIKKQMVADSKAMIVCHPRLDEMGWTPEMIVAEDAERAAETYLEKRKTAYSDL